MMRFLLIVLACAMLPAAAAGQFRTQGDPFSPPPNTGKGLENARIFQPGPLGSPGKWEIRGDGSGPVIVGGEVYIPGGPGQRGTWVGQQGVNRSSGPQVESPGRGSAEILAEVEREQERRRQEAEPPPGPTQPPALTIENLSPLGAARVLEAVDSDDPSRRASALASLPATRLTTLARARAVRVLARVLDDGDLRLVAIAARSLGQLGAVQAASKLVGLLNLEDRDVLVAACEALGQVGSAGSLEALDSLSGAKDSAVVAAGARAAAEVRAHLAATVTRATTTAGGP